MSKKYKIKKTFPLWTTNGFRTYFVDDELGSEVENMTKATLEYLVTDGWIAEYKPVRYEYIEEYRLPEIGEPYIGVNGRVYLAEASNNAVPILKPLTAYTESEIREAFKEIAKDDITLPTGKFISDLLFAYLKGSVK